MIDKKRRDITLGEMQDECKRRNRDCTAHTNCEYRWYCDPILNATEFDSITPLSNDLTDPPRFNEDQMAVWRGWYAVGARTSKRDKTRCYVYDAAGEYIGSFEYGCITKRLDTGIKDGETLDLAELLDSESKT